MKKLFVLAMLLATPAYAEIVKLEWDPNPVSDNVTRYHVYRSEGLVDPAGTPVDFRGIAAPTTNKVTDQLPDDGLTYTYAVKAFNGQVESVFSNQVSATTRKAPSDPVGLKRVAQLQLREPIWIKGISFTEKEWLYLGFRRSDYWKVAANQAGLKVATP